MSVDNRLTITVRNDTVATSSWHDAIFFTPTRHKWLTSYGFKNYENSHNLKKIEFQGEDEWEMMLVSYIRSFIEQA